MSIKTNFYDGQSYLPQDMINPWKSLLDDGVFNVSSGALAPSANSPANLSVNMAAGAAIKNGYYIKSDAAVNIPITSNTSGYNRIDIIVLEVDPDNKVTSIKAVQGTPSSSPTAPLPTANQLKIAEIAVGNNVSVINKENITDARADVDILGGRLEEINMQLGNKISVPGTAYTPLDLHFKRKACARNFYNLSLPLAKMDLATNFLLADSNMYPKTNYTANGNTITNPAGKITLANSLSTTEESVVEVGGVFPYGTYDIDVSAYTTNAYYCNCMIEFSKDINNRIIISNRHKIGSGAILTIDVYTNQSRVKTINLTDDTSGSIMAAPYTLRVQLEGTTVHVFRIKDGVSTYCGYLDISSNYDLRDPSVCKDFKFKVGARLGQGESITFSRVEENLTCGTGQADPRVMKYKDGAPIIKDNRLYMTMSTRGFAAGAGDCFNGVYSLDLTTFNWHLEGAILFDNGDGILKPYLGAEVIYDDDEAEWRIFATSFTDDHKLYCGTLNKSPLHGITIATVSILNYPSGDEDEDLSIIYDSNAGKWRMAYCATSSWVLKLAESDNWNGPYTITKATSASNRTGTLIQKIGGTRYVICGYQLNYEIYSYPDLTYIGTLNCDIIPNGNNVWACVVPICDGSKTKYMMVSFDRGQITGRYSYGALYIYEATERNTGYEYNIKQCFML